MLRPARLCKWRAPDPGAFPASAAMFGPLRKVPGSPTFTYWDPAGTAALLPTQVARIRLVLRTEDQIPGGVVRMTTSDSAITFL